MSQPRHSAHISGNYPEELNNPKRNMFSFLKLGTEFYFEGKILVKITNSYYNINNKMINAIDISNGELFYINCGLCVGIL
jgi:hypothetical protein